MNTSLLFHFKISPHILKFTVLGFNENMNAMVESTILLLQNGTIDSNIDRCKTKPSTYVNVKKYYIY